MATYKMTPADRRAYAQIQRERREGRYEAYRQRNAAKDLAESQKNAELQETRENERAKDASVAERVGVTLWDLFAQAVFGVWDTTEGIVDTGLGAVGAVGGLFSEDFRNTMQEAVEYDVTNELLVKPQEDLLKKSYLNDGKAGEITRNVSRGIGGMLPSVLATYLTGNPTVGLAALGTGAAGGATEEAYADGAGYYEGLGYGALSGGAEVLTEKMFGGMTSKIFGGGMLDDVSRSLADSVADTGMKRVVKNTLEEAAEEAVASAVDPALKSIYKGREAFEEYKDPEFYKGMGESALVGGLTSLAFGGLSGNLGRSADISDSLSEIDGLRRKQSNLFTDDKLTEDVQEKIRQATEANLRNVETALKKSKPERRAVLIERFELSEGFDADGSLKPDYAARLLGEEVSTDGTNAAESPLASADKRYFSPSLWNRTKTVAEDLNKITNDLRKKSGEDVPAVEVYADEMSETAKASYSQMKKAFAKLSGKTRTGMNFVLVKPNAKFDGAMLTEGNTLYIAADTLENGTWAKKMVHEVTHFTEGSKGYNKMIRHLASDADLLEQIATRLTASQNGYGFTRTDLEGLLAKMEKGEARSGIESELESEINAQLAEEVLGNEAFINKLVRSETSLAEKIMAKIHDLLDAFQSLTHKEARAEYNRLQKAEKLYLKAVEGAGWKYVKGEIEKEKENEGVDNEGVVRYNKKEKQPSKKRLYYSQYQSSVMQWSFAPSTKLGDVKSFYNPIDNTWNIFIADDSEDRCGLLESVEDSFENVEKIKEIIKENRHDSNSTKQRVVESFHNNFGRYRNVRRDYRYDSSNAEKHRSNGRSRVIFRATSDGDGNGDSPQGNRDSEKVKYSLKDPISDEIERERNFNYSEGQEAKADANVNRKKVYTKQDAQQIVSAVLAGYMNFGEAYGNLLGKSRTEVVEMLWKGLNKAEPGRRGRVALDVADYILQNAMVQDAVEDPANEVHRDTVNLLKTYIRKLDLSRIKAEIRNKYQKDTSVFARWGKRKGTVGMPPDVAAMELAELGYQIEATPPADILFEMDAAYRKATQALKRQASNALKEVLSPEERDRMRQEIAREILKGYDEHGSESKLAKVINDYTAQVQAWKNETKEERGRNDLVNRALDRLQKLKDLKLGTYHNASEYNDARFRGSIEKLAEIKYRGVLRKAKTRKIFAELLPWYSPQNALFKNQEGIYQQEIADMMDQLAHGEGKLTGAELKMLIKVVDYFTHMVNTYNKVWRNGKYEDAEPIAKRYVAAIQRANATQVGLLSKWYQSRYFLSMADPVSLMKYADRYDKQGFYTEMFREFQRGAVGAALTQMELTEEYNAFLKKHKKFADHLVKDTVEINGKQVPINLAISLYMTTKRAQAWRGLVKSGFELELDGKLERFAALAEPDAEMGDTEIRKIAEDFGKRLYSSFSEIDKQFIKIIEDTFNLQCAHLKRETDMQRLGYTNISEGAYYYPIIRAQIAKNIDKETFFEAMDRVSNLSINKNLVEGAAGELMIRPVDEVFTRHIRQVSMYANLAHATDTFNRLYNLNTGNNRNKPITVQSETSLTQFGRDMNEYLKKLKQDIEGVPVGARDQKLYNEAIGFLRSGYAKYQLGANPKVLVSQLSSFFAAHNVLDFDSIVKGFGVRGKKGEVDSYCPLAKLRNTENTAAMAQGVLDKTTGKVGDLLMAPIGKIDRFVVIKLFGACQVQVEKNGGAKVGTDANKLEAGELLQQVILETQQNALATERSGAMRSGEEILKSFTMFSADSMKTFGRVMDAIGESSVIRRRLKTELLNDSERTAMQKRLKKANKQVARSTAALVAGAVFMAIVALGFRWLYRKDEEKDGEEIAREVTLDSIGNLIGGLPVLRDVYSFFADGYEIDNFVLATVNDLLGSAKDTVNLATDAANGKDVSSQDVAVTVRKLFYAAGQVLGIPTRNIYNFLTGLTKRISPSTGYWIDSRFYEPSYNTDLQKAIEADDERLISMISGLIVDEKIGAENKKTREALRTLVSAGYDVLPRALGDSVTYDGEKIELTARQRKRFQSVYSASDEAVEDLVKLSTFQNASEEDRAKAVKFIYDTYYNLALDDLVGADSENKNVLFAEAIDIEKLALIVATARGLQADVDSSGKAVSGSRKSKIVAYVSALKLTAAQKYMIMGYLGYSNKLGKETVKAYINGLNLSKAEKDLLLGYSGY